MQMKRQSGFLAGIGITSKPQMKLKRRKIDPEKLTNKDVWHNRRKKGRLVIRNLPFKITDDKLKEHFEKFGVIKDVKLLRRNDGKLVGCGFVEFEKREDAKNALEECSGKPLLNRPIVVDWAVPKDVYKGTQNVEMKTDPDEDDIKEEPEDLDSEDEKPNVDVKKDLRGKDEDSDESESRKSDPESSQDESDNEEEDDDAESEEDEEMEDEEQISDDEEEKAKKKRLDDLDQGKTVFLKCVPFSATEDDLRECLGKFGPIAYALICVDRVTEHSKGTGFVKFRNKESADKCLEAGASELRIGSGVLDPHKALDKRQLQKNYDDKKTETAKKDNRNLYLLKEGVVLAGTAAAKGVSPVDMTYRLQLEQSKSQMLRNFSTVISPIRLAVHNLPENYSDEALRNMFKKHVPAGANITEARIMRDLKRVDAKGKGLSKGYGFVSFTRHDHALAALRAVNNNPNVFTPKQRPIVSFSLENKAILNARQKRLEMSKVKNPTFQAKSKHSKPSKETASISKGKVFKTGEDFVGIEAHKSQKVKLPTRGTLKAQAALHRQSLNAEKKKVKRIKQEEKMKQDRKKKTMEPKSKKKKKTVSKDHAEEKAFDTMVNKYKGMVSNKNIKKWYE